MPRSYIRKIESKAVLAREIRLKQINDLLAQGKSQYQIAQILGVSKQNINQQLSRPKYLARKKVRLAIERGELMKPSLCEKCLVVPPTSAHHDDYDKPLDVLWVCEQCHVAVDNKGIKQNT